MKKTKKNNIKNRYARVNIKSKKNMKGGFAPDEMQNLLDNGFQQNQVNELSNKNITLDTVNQAIEYFNDNSHQIIVGIAENFNANATPLSNLSLDDSSSNQPVLNVSNLQTPESNEMPQAQSDTNNINTSQPLNLNGDVSGNAVGDISGNTVGDVSGNAVADVSGNVFGNISGIANNPLTGGKRTKKNNKRLKRNKTYRKIKGGAMYGTGYGANCYDPNFSIYNTNLTKLFPYRPTN